METAVARVVEMTKARAVKATGVRHCVSCLHNFENGFEASRALKRLNHFCERVRSR